MKLNDENFMKLWRGEIAFDRFVRECDPALVGMTNYLLRRWNAPFWYDADDVKQEMHLAMWRCLERFDAAKAQAKGYSLCQYMIWGILDGAKKKIHKARGALLSGNADGNPSRFEIPTEFSQEQPIAAEQEDWVNRGMTYEHARLLCDSSVEEFALMEFANAGGSCRVAAERMFRSDAFHVSSRAICVKTLERFVRSTVQSVVADLETAA